MRNRASNVMRIQTYVVYRTTYIHHMFCYVFTLYYFENDLLKSISWNRSVQHSIPKSKLLFVMHGLSIAIRVRAYVRAAMPKWYAATSRISIRMRFLFTFRTINCNAFVDYYHIMCMSSRNPDWPWHMRYMRYNLLTMTVSLSYT